jgi:nucleoside-specific outer membrane channel protein Tsx
MSIKAGFLCLILSLGATSATTAQSPVEWHSENVQILRGESFELGDSDRTILTLEHASRWRYGDLFIFTDFSFSDNGDDGVYGEISPRFSLSRITGNDWQFGIVQDVLIALNYERGEMHTQRYLAGIAADLDIPGFRFVRAHAYHRDDPNRPGSTWQATLVWNRGFEFAGQSFLAEGFADIAGAEGAGVANQLIVPRLLWDIGALHDQPGRLYLGIERQYWHNKFGVDGVTENVTQLQLKWVLN